MKQIGVKLDQDQDKMLNELQALLQAKNSISKVTRSDVIKYALTKLYNDEKLKREGE